MTVSIAIPGIDYKINPDTREVSAVYTTPGGKTLTGTGSTPGLAQRDLNSMVLAEAADLAGVIITEVKNPKKS